MKKIAIVGGTGFLGLFFIENLLKDGFQVLLILRTASIKKVEHLLQDYPENFKILHFDFSNLEKNNIDLSNVDVFIYLIGILFENKSTTFEKAHFIWPKYFIHLSQKFYIQHFIFFSAISRIPFISKKYILTKELTENYLKSLKINYTIFKPSFIYKKHLFFSILNKILTITNFLPFLKKLSLFKPIYIGNLYLILKHRILNSNPKNLSLSTKDFNQFYFLFFILKLII